LASLLAQRIFRRRDFAEGLDGSCRLLPPLTHELAGSLRVWESAVGPWAEFVAATLGRTVEGKFRTSRPLTGGSRRQAQAEIKLRRARVRAAASSHPNDRPEPRHELASKLETAASCVECGGLLARSQHLRCPTCWESQPGQSEEARARRGRGIARTRAELEGWKRSHPESPLSLGDFAAIREGLAQVKLSEIMAACQVSKSTASMIRAGRHVPALRHWEALAAVVRSAGDRKPGPSAPS
jgi:hypothetical protein